MPACRRSASRRRRRASRSASYWGRRAPAGAALEPAAVQPLAAGAVVCGALAGSSFMSISATERAGLIVVAPELLRFPYHLRYELIEFAVYCLAARAQQLVPLHAACIAGRRGGALVLGASGAGKSTLMLHGLRSGLRFLAEDSVLVRARGLLATGVANFLHVRADSLRFLAGTRLARQIRAAPVIVRRSGIRKYEFDLRGGDFRLAGAPVPLQALVFLSARRARDGALLRRLPAATLAARLRRGSPTPRTSQGGEPFSCGRGGCRPSSCAAGRTRARRWRRSRSCSTGRRRTCPQGAQCAGALGKPHQLLAGLPRGELEVGRTRRVGAGDAAGLDLAAQPHVREAVVVAAVTAFDEVVAVGALRPVQRQADALAHRTRSRACP